MRHFASVLAVWCASWCSFAAAGPWTEGLFSELRHDFGSVPRGADVRHTFVLSNNTGAPIRISGMHRTCGCTQITLDDKIVLDQNIQQNSESKVIGPDQTVRIGVVLDTRKFIGNKSAEITLIFDQPALAEVRLTVSSFIRQYIVLNPGAVQFGTLTRGQELTKALEIEYAGQSDWRIQNVTSSNSNLELKYDETVRSPGHIGYKLTVTLKPDAPAGSIRDTLIVETNDPVSSKVPVLVSAQVQPDLIVTPSSLSFGNVKPGQTVTRNVLLRGKKPFRVTQVNGADGRFQFEGTDSAQSFHKLTVRFVGDDQSGTVDSTFRIETDLPDDPWAEIKASVQVVP